MIRKATSPATKVAAKKNGLAQRKLPANAFTGIPLVPQWKTGMRKSG